MAAPTQPTPPSQAGTEPVRAATLQGFAAIALWSSLAALTTLVGAIPPFQLAAITFAIATAAGLVLARLRGQDFAALRAVPAGAWLLGVYGLLTYHVCYFLALATAPALEANLINYLWPLLIVVLSAALPAAAGGRRLGIKSIVGAALGFAATALLLGSAAGRAGREGGLGIGHAAALAAAIVWATYSVGSRLYAAVPSLAVTGSCAATALCAGLLHLAFEPTVWPAGPVAWAAVLAMGLGPVGIAFTLWDRAMKHGNMRLIGVASYATPLLSTLLLTLTGKTEATPALWLAACLVSAGALLAARDT